MKPMMFGVYIEPSLRPVRHDSADRVLRTSVPDALAPVATVSSRVVAERDAGETRGTDVSDVDMDSSLEDLQKASAAARRRFHARRDAAWMTPRS